ncbi:glycosyltransferase family 2 protein [Paragemmobacter ruber]|nr:glycosyltransferase family 2 protein [Rhodobacter ruber]
MKVDRKAERPRGASDLWGSVPLALKRHISPHGQVTAVSMMKDEGPFVIEWVAHHLAVGFTDLVVYTNDCSDGTDDMLIRLEELGLAHHRRNVIPEGLRPQPSALNHAQEEPVVGKSDWVMVFDADEFLSIRYGDGTLDDLITAAKAQDANGIVVTWRIFGSGGVVDWSRAPVTEQYLYAAPPMWNKGWGVKTLFTFDPDYWKLGIHRPKMKNRHIDTGFPDTVKWLTGSGREMEDYFKFRGWRSITRTIGYDWVQLNHYAVKSVDSYAIRKMRGNVNNKKDKYNSDYWSLQDRNEVFDDTMLRYSDRRNAIMAQLLEDPVLNRLHHAAIDRAEARLAELKQTEAYHELVADLARASAVPITQITAKPPQARDKEKIAALMSDVEKRRNAKAKEDRKAAPAAPKPPITPMGSYVTGRIDAALEAPMDWKANHAVDVPMDPRVFTPPALLVIEAGKFERGLARRMPQVLPKDATLLVVGAGCGFLPVHLSRVRPDLAIVMQESEAGLHPVITRLCARNGRAFDDRFRLIDGPLGKDGLVSLVAVHRPGAVILADAGLGPDDLIATLPAVAPLPAQLFLTGRWIEAWHPDVARVEAALAERGWHGPQFGFDPVLTRGYGRVAGPTPPTDARG